jgi:hypothetical protein
MNRHLTPAEIADGIPSLRPSRRQGLRRLISLFRHESQELPWGDEEYRAYKAADRLDRAAEIRAEIASDNARPVLVDDDWFERDEFRRKADIARSIWAGGQ